MIPLSPLAACRPHAPLPLADDAFCERRRRHLPVVWSLFVVVVLSHPLAAGDVGSSRRVTAKVELAGKLRLNGDGSGVTERPLQATGTLTYDESWLAVDGEGRPLQAVRTIREATAKMQVGKWATQPVLPDRERGIVAGWYDDRLRLHSATSPLTQAELDTVDLQCDPLALEQFFSRSQRRQIQSGQWQGPSQLTSAVVAAMLRWDVVSKHSVACRLVRRAADRGVWVLELEGEALGAVDGATCEANLRGKLNYDPAVDQVTWADVQISEQRAIGHAAPGLDVTARIRVQATAGEPLAADALKRWQQSIPRNPPETAWYLAFHSKRQGFELLHAPAWKLMVDGPTMTIFRLIHDGDLIAQANFSRVADSERPSLGDFQRQIEQALAGRIDRIVTAEQEDREDGTRVYRVIAAGAVESLPIQWMYYYFRNADGKAISCAITMDARLVERFAGADESLVASLRVLTLPPRSEARADGDAAENSIERR